MTNDIKRALLKKQLIASFKEFEHLTRSERIKARNERAKVEADHIKVDFPQTKYLSTRDTIKYKKAIEKYPDLMPFRANLTLLAYDFREEQLRDYGFEKMGEIANGRSDITSIEFKEVNMPTDLPGIGFHTECVVCAETKNTIQICPVCWGNIRKCLDLKAKHSRDGWDGWGYDMALDLEPLKKLLAENAA